jgi:hypothetical protein
VLTAARQRAWNESDAHDQHCRGGESEAILTGGDGIERFGQRADEHARWIVARVLPLDVYSYSISPTWRNI